ncbi:MAG: outer membrane beta-barrel protein [Alphaproteobacteria bacterium]|nr:outer membrane beta-barrel protein [Alphaproteobacteria bacterium]
MTRRFVLLGSALVLALTLPLTAQAETKGFYIGAGVGADFAVDSAATAAAGRNTVRYDAGPSGLVTVGYGFGAFRTELEGAYRTNDVSGTGGALLGNVGGSARTWSLMVNGLYDINTGTPFTPYLGAGVGVGFVNASLSGTRPAGSPTGLYNGSDTTFAYQAIAGVSYAVTPRLSLTADYRYVATTDASFNSGGASWNVENANHVLTAGFRWTLGN